MKRIGIVASSLLKAIVDHFTRTSSTSLGSTDTGSAWTAVSGTWGTNGSQGYTNTTGGTTTSSSVFPVATVEGGTTNVTMSVQTSPGMGLSFWVTDANNWWSASTYETNYSCNCVNYTNNCAKCGSTSTYACNTVTDCTVCGSSTSYYTTGNSSIPCDAGDTQVSASNCSPATNNCCRTTTCSTCTPTYPSCGSCGTCGSYVSGSTCNSCTADCATCTNRYVRIIKKISGTVSQVSSTSVSAAVAALKVILSGTGITVRAYSDTGMTTQLGSDITATNPSSPSATAHGLIKAQSDNQGTTVDEFNLQS